MWNDAYVKRLDNNNHNNNNNNNNNKQQQQQQEDTSAILACGMAMEDRGELDASICEMTHLNMTGVVHVWHYSYMKSLQWHNKADDISAMREIEMCNMWNNFEN